MPKVKAKYDCRDCYSFIHGADVKWRLPDKMVMAVTEDELRKLMTGPFCPHCGSGNVIEALPKGNSDG